MEPTKTFLSLSCIGLVCAFVLIAGWGYMQYARFHATQAQLIETQQRLSQLQSATAHTSGTADAPHATVSSTLSPAAVAPVTRDSQCEAFATSQLKALGLGDVSGTKLTHTYNAATGFCSVHIAGKTPYGSYENTFVTNTFNTSTTQPLPHLMAPVEVYWPVANPVVCRISPETGKRVCRPFDADAIEDALYE